MIKTDAFDRFWGLGFKRLVPIIPPDARISEKSTLYRRVDTKQDGRGKTPGTRSLSGTWSSFDWTPYEADERDLQRWHGMGAGTGIKTGNGLIAIDADTLNADRAKIIRDTIEQKLGRLPIRVGNYPKALYLCRVDGPFQYCRIEFGERDEENRLQDRVEILSDGRQFVAHGIHPKTNKPYEWPRDIVPFDQLPVFSPNQITGVLDALRPLLPAASPLIKEGGTTEVNQNALRGKLDHVAKAVEAIPNTSALFPSRESYRDMGYAIKAALSDDEQAAFELFASWCAKWQDGSNDPDIVEADWRRMKPPFRRGAGWLYELAETHGADQFSSADIWFEDIAEPDNPFAVLEAAAPPPASDTYPLLDIQSIMTRPAPRWLLTRHVPVVGVGFLYSEPGIGKSFLTLDMALHIAFGFKDWNGDPIDAPDDAMVLYIAAEGSYGFRNRIKAWMKHKGIPADQQGRFRMIEQTINFMSTDDVQKLLRTAKSIAGLRPCLIVVDTVSRAMPGADENLQKEMTLFVRACDVLRDAFRCAVLGVHHAGKSGEMRGSTVLLGAGDFVFRLVRKKGATIGHLVCEKQKDGPDGWDEAYQFDTIGLEDGETSLIVARAIIGAGVMANTALTPTTTEAVLAAMRAAWEAGAPWSKARQAKDRFAIRKMIVDFGFDGIKAEEMLNMWEAMGFISVAMVSSDSKLKGYKVLVDPGQHVLSESIFD